ncbi:MAG: RluA family pseudouridine synthase [Fimbriimonadaceae bacterium]|nr:RluA family pseudouridine synthase [Alphaproteobacteria bacterium]
MDSDRPQIKKFAVTPDEAGKRLDQFITDQNEELSRSRVKALIKAGHAVSDSGKILEPNHRVNAGEEISFTLPAPAPAEPEGEDIPLDILFEDEHLIVIDKPAGLVVHPAAGNWSGTLVNALIAHCGESLSGIGGVRRPGIVHRLDKDTSGVMVIAKTDPAHKGLAAQFADHGRTGSLERAYLAVVWGTPVPRRGTIDAPLARSSQNRLKRAVVRETHRDAKQAITHYKTRQELSGEATLVECRLETGRTHQIRVHMAHIGHPLLGDQVYASGFRTKESKLGVEALKALKKLNRQALHAYLLGFDHPISGDAMRFEAELPADLADLIRQISRPDD